MPGIHPGASNSNKQFKHYPEVIMSIDSILDNNCVYFLFEGNNESSVADKVEETLIDIGRDYIRIKKSLKEYISIVSLFDFMLCNDSAAGHIAAAYGVPSIVIFGPVEKEVAIPYSKSVVIGLSSKMECKPCTLPVCKYGTESCLEKIEISDIKNAFCFLWNNVNLTEH